MHKSNNIVLAGNPNVGKSVFFNALTGMYVDVSNFPGTTVDISQGTYKDKIVIDTPGVYGVSSFNDEEKVARDVILSADIILNVVDAVHLDRDLFLTQQLIDMGKPIIVALNMMDDVKRNGLSIDVKKLESLLGVPIIETIAPKKIGIDKVISSIDKARPGNPIDIVNENLNVLNNISNKAEALLILEDDESIKSKNSINKTFDLRDTIYINRRNRVNEIVTSVLSESKTNLSFKINLSRIMLNPKTGFPLLFATLIVMFTFLGVFIAQTIVGYTEDILMGTYYHNFIMNIFEPLFSKNSFLYDLILGTSGLLTMVPTYVFGLLLPLVAGFYLLLSILEDSGYLPRIAALVDKGMTKLGLNGRAIIPMILGFGCVTMAVISTRILGSKRERFIATMLLGLAIPCSAQFGVIVGMMSSLGFKYIVIYSVTIILVFVIAGLIMNKILPGKSSDLLIDIPPLRLPKASNIFSKTLSKSIQFVKEATPLFAIGAVLITLLEHFNILIKIQIASEPLVVTLLKLPKEVTTPFIMGLIRRDFGAAGLFELTKTGMLTQPQTLVSLVVITLFVPCLAAVLVIFKERGVKDALIIWFGSFITSFVVGAILAQIII